MLQQAALAEGEARLQRPRPVHLSVLRLVQKQPEPMMLEPWPPPLQYPRACQEQGWASHLSQSWTNHQQKERTNRQQQARLNRQRQLWSNHQPQEWTDHQQRVWTNHWHNL